jgi:two-component system chemotaxis response regulator CheB
VSRIKVIVVDDSAVVRQTVTALLEDEPGIEVIGAVADPILAMARMKITWPDVVVLDIEMPRMDGITFLRKLMAERPTPVVICSSLTQKGAHTTMEALAAGAVSIITKPKIGAKQFLVDSCNDLVTAVKVAAQANVKRLSAPSAPASLATKRKAEVILPGAVDRAIVSTTARVIAIGTSTGGTRALETVLTTLPRVSPGIVIEVREAQDNDRVMQGRALVAPGGKHMLLKRSGLQYHVAVVDGPLFNRHRPSVDVLFRSVAKFAGANALGIIMTGMGDDGAAGMLEMRKAGAHTIAQDEESCVVFGMPKEAIKRGAVERTVPLSEISREILQQLH